MDKRSILEASGEEEPSRVYKVDLSNRNIREIGLVREFERLRCLILSYNMISQIQNLQYFPDLRELHIESNGLQRLEGLEGNRALQVVNLRSNRIQKIQNLGHLLKLQTLILDHNCITKVSGLEYLKDLKNLYISHNSIESLQNLPAFSKLSYLNLSHNKIRSISVNLFASSKSLSFVDLSHNRIESTSFLQSMGSLQNLNLSHNRIKEFQAVTMPNLEDLNLSENEIQKLPIMGICFPELVSLDISANMICSEFELLQVMAETEYLTELDFRNNPMYTQSFEKGIQKVHCLDFLNGKSMTKAGAKYYDKIDKIQEDLRQNREIYGEDDERDREIKMSGFFDEQLEFRMTGMKAVRPSSPKKRKNLDKPTFYEDIDKTYHEFSQNDLRIKVLREQYLKICGQYDIKGSQHILTELPAESAEFVRAPSQEQKSRQSEQKNSHPFVTSEHEIKKENQKNLNKWKELKQRQKSFNIREVIKKSRGRDSSMNRGASSTTNSNWPGLKTQKMKSELMKTQAVPRKTGEELFKTMLRPRSTHKKE